MSSFIALRKSFDLSTDENARILVGRQTRDIPVLSADGAIVTALKKHYDFEVTVKFDTAGGSNCDPKQYYLGKKYNSFPTTTKSQCIFNGWFTQPSGGTQILSSSPVELSNTTLYAQWERVSIASDCTQYVAQATASYKNTGIYMATRYSAASAVYVDWGDGSVQKINGDISALAHTYASAGVYNVKVSNNVTTFAPNTNNSTWHTTTSQNRYTFKTMVKTGSRLRSISAMPSYAFYYCNALSTIDWLSSCYTGITSILSYAFQYCTSVKTLSTLPARIKAIKSYGFANCTGLTGIQDLRNTGLTGLTGTYSLYYCSNVKEWKLPSTLTAANFGMHVFEYNTTLSAIQLPAHLTSIASYSFRYDSQLKTITIPNNVKAIAAGAFSGCTQLSSVDWQTTALTSIASYAFKNCTGLRDINVPQSVKTIAQYVFQNCYSTYASALNLPSGLTALNQYAYSGCYGLKTVSIPSAVAKINGYVFNGCYNVSSITDYRLTAQGISSTAFGTTASNSYSTGYTGYATHGKNKLRVYADAEDYDTGYWLDPLQLSTKCGFEIEYIDPENVKYCNVTFNAGDGTIGDLSASYVVKQLKQKSVMLELPTPTCPEATPYFGGWYTEKNGAGIKYSTGAKVPAQSEITLYALYSDSPFCSYTVDLNSQWRQSTVQANPDSSLYDGVYESNSNYNVNSQYAKMYVRIDGYTKFTIYIRTYTSNEMNYDYAIAMNLDTDVTSLPSTSTSGVKATTYGKSSSGTSVSDYVKVEYADIDGGSHFICVVYRKDSTQHGGTDRGYLLIPKEQ